VAGIIAAGAVLMLAARFGLRAAEGRVRRPAGVLDEEKQLRTAAAGGPAAPAGIAGAAKTRPVMLTNAGTVLAMTARFDPSTPNVARVCNHWLGGKDASPADRAETNQKPGLCSRHLGLGCA
jgi:hypothetical protein